MKKGRKFQLRLKKHKKRQDYKKGGRTKKLRKGKSRMKEKRDSDRNAFSLKGGVKKDLRELGGKIGIWKGNHRGKPWSYSESC